MPEQTDQPLLSDEVMNGHELVPDKWAPSGHRLTFRPMTKEAVRDFYEQARKQDKDRIRELENERRWIPVSERLPDEGQRVLAAFTDGVVRLTVLQRSFLRSSGTTSGELMWNVGSAISPQLFQAVTHWMPLPNPPTKP